MKRGGLLRLMVALVMAVFLLSACGGCGVSIPVGLGPFEGRLLVLAGGGVWELSKHPDVVGENWTHVAGPGVCYASVSPDGSYLVYSTCIDADEALSSSPAGCRTRLRDLTTGAEQDMLPVGSDAPPIAWNRHAATLGYYSGLSLYACSMATGQSTLIYTAPSCTYYVGGDPKLPLTLHGWMACGTWIGGDRLLFNSTSSAGMTCSGYGIVGIPADTVNMAIVGENVQLESARGVAQVTEISPDGACFLVRYPADGGHGWMSRVSRSFGDPADLSARDLPARVSPHFSHNGGELVYLSRDSGGCRATVHFIDTVTLEERLGPTLSYPHCFDLDDWALVGDEDHNLMVQESTGHLFVIDLDTGEMTKVPKPDSGGGAGLSCEVLACLPLRAA